MLAKPTNKARCFSYKVFKVHSKLTNKTTSFMELLQIEKYWKEVDGGQENRKRSSSSYSCIIFPLLLKTSPEFPTLHQFLFSISRSPVIPENLWFYLLVLSAL